VCPAKPPSLKASTEIITATAMFAYTGFNFANMAHPLSIKSIEIICCSRIQLLISPPYMEQPLCQRVPPLVIYLKNKTFWLTGGISVMWLRRGMKQFTKLQEKGLSSDVRESSAVLKFGRRLTTVNYCCASLDLASGGLLEK
jgi:hypothetical protein